MFLVENDYSRLDRVATHAGNYLMAGATLSAAYDSVRMTIAENQAQFNQYAANFEGSVFLGMMGFVIGSAIHLNHHLDKPDQFV